MTCIGYFMLYGLLCLMPWVAADDGEEIPYARLTAGQIAGIVLGTFFSGLGLLGALSYCAYKDMLTEKTTDIELHNMVYDVKHSKWTIAPVKPDPETLSEVKAPHKQEPEVHNAESSDQSQSPKDEVDGPGRKKLKLSGFSKQKDIPNGPSSPSHEPSGGIQAMHSFDSFENPLYGEPPTPTIENQKFSELFVDPVDGKLKIGLDGYGDDLGSSDMQPIRPPRLFRHHSYDAGMPVYGYTDIYSTVTSSWKASDRRGSGSGSSVDSRESIPPTNTPRPVLSTISIEEEDYI